MRVCRLLWALSPALTMHVFVGCCYRPVPLPCTAALPQDILKKEDGAYLKYAMGSMLDIRYQVRSGLLAAGNFGVPQGRWRCFMWAAAPGQQLPALPKPTHNCLDFNVSEAGRTRGRRTADDSVGQCIALLFGAYPACWLPLTTRPPVPPAPDKPLLAQCVVAVSAQLACVGFLSEADAALSGHPPVLLGDILDDLPPVDNFELHERQRYLCEPQRVTQVCRCRVCVYVSCVSCVQAAVVGAMGVETGGGGERACVEAV